MGQCYGRKSRAPASETTQRSRLLQRRIKEESLKTGQMTFTLAHLEALEICLQEALSEQSKLLERSWLEENLEALDYTEQSGKSYEKMVLAKDQYIEKFQSEVKVSQEQLRVHKLKHKRKLEKLQTDLATAKREAAIRVLELNEKIKTLYKGKPAPREDSSPEESSGGLPLVEDSNRKISLSMELSTQVSLQTEKITLEKVLEEKEDSAAKLGRGGGGGGGCHPFPEVKYSPECLQEAPIFFNISIIPVVSEEDM
ncbi:LOW QUALITY PROTEIN: coiled-coil domain-containing protein 192 [Rhynchonycteris naso]